MNLKRDWLLVIAAILLFFGTVLLTVGVLTDLDARKTITEAPAHYEPGPHYL